LAKVHGPLFSLDARNKIGNALVYGIWKGIPWVRCWRKPQNPKEPDQVAQRLIFSQGIDAWHFTLTAPDQVLWQEAVDEKGLVMSGFNYHQSEYINAMRAGEVPAVVPA